MPSSPPFVDLRAAGSMVCDVPAHKMGDRGSAYRYGATIVGGTRNMISNGEVLRNIMVDQTGPITGGPGLVDTYSLLLGGTGAGKYDQMSNTKHVQVVTKGSGATGSLLRYAVINCNGEMCVQATTLAQYGGLKEAFTMGGITATVVGASDNVVFSASIAALALTFAYGYTPMFNVPRVGDLVEVVQGGNSYWHRLTQSFSGTSWRMYPAWNGSNAAGLVTRIWRTGWGSFSKVIWIDGGGYDNLYYVGNVLDNSSSTGGAGGADRGTIQAIDGGAVHYMAPHLSPSGANLVAVDICYFKNFLLYGAGHVIGWSNEAAPFPQSPATAFAANDFLDTSTNAGFTSDEFVCFEELGDQVVALFKQSAYLVQATGTLPAFEFHRLTQCPGVYNKGVIDAPSAASSSGAAYISYTRPACHSASSIFFASEQGIMEVRGAPPASEIGTPVNSYIWPSPDNTFDFSYDPPSDSVVIFDGHTTGLLYRRGDWSELDLSGQGVVRAVAGGISAKNQASEEYRRIGIGYWIQGSQKVYELTASMNEENIGSVGTASLCGWTWASPVLDCGAVYDGFKFGGFQIIARAEYAASAPINMGWALWVGQNPYSMSQIDSGSFDYKSGHESGRSRIGGVKDWPYVAVKLSGNWFVELWGIRIFPADTAAGR